MTVKNNKTTMIDEYINNNLDMLINSNKTLEELCEDFNKNNNNKKVSFPLFYNRFKQISKNKGLTKKRTRKTKEEINKAKQQEISEVLNGSSTDSTDNEDLEALKEVKIYYLLYKEIDKNFNIIISKRKDYKQKKYFACISSSQDKDLIMEFENHFKYNVDNIKVPWNYNYFQYRTHDLTKNKLKQEMNKFIKSLGVGYHIDYFSTVNNWEGKD